MYLVTLFLKCTDSSLVDIFQQQNFNLASVKGTKLLGFGLTERTRASTLLFDFSDGGILGVDHFVLLDNKCGEKIKEKEKI
jgi:hypothetical protein